MLRIKFLLLFLFLALVSMSYAQEKTLRCKKIAWSSDTLALDSLPIYPDLLPLNHVSFVPPNFIVFKPDFKGDSLLVCYRVLLPSRFKTNYQVRDRLENSDNPKPIDPYTKVAPSNPTQDQIFTNGSVSRGISSGNNQGFLINSDLNLQLQGDLGKGVRLTAAVSDNNSPLQPDGTTLQIQDFDRVFVKIDKDSWFAVAGDYFMSYQVENHFLVFNKKSRGLQFEGAFKSNYFDKISTQTHAAISRGRFSRNEIQGQEGLQGPYRLQGAQNETFVIVIAATEVVYVDGKRLTRGEQNDYVINYNTAEILFNPNILITQYSRIVVEFQYADQNYSRILFNQGIGLQKNKLKLRMNYFIEQDNKNQPFQAENTLTLFDSANNIDARKVLADAGDNKSKAVIGTTRIENSFSNNKILYRIVDSLGFEDVLIYQAQQNDSFTYYTATFSNVGVGQGNYIQINSSANGRVYAWVQPNGGQPQGTFEPVVQLVAPVRQQMATVAMDYQLTKNSMLIVEGAYSQLNNNTFSVLDKSDDDAFGSFIQLNTNKELAKDYTLQNKFYWERVSSGFAYIERYRNVEFDRKWNRSLSNPTSGRVKNAEQIFDVDGELGNLKNRVEYGLSAYEVKGNFLGISPSLMLQKQLTKKIQVRTGGNWLKSENLDSLKTEAYQLDANTQVRFNDNYTISGFAHMEMNAPRFIISDTYTSRAFQFQQYGTKGNLKFKNGWVWQTGVDLRSDQLPVSDRFLWASDGINVNNEISKAAGSKRFALISNLRFLTQNRQFFAKQKEQFLQQRLEYADNNYKKGFRVNFYLQSGTGREQKKEFVFIEVPAGQGQYAWNDYNTNGVKEINEFELSVFKDQAKFIKVFNITNEFVNANQHEGNFSLNLRPSAWFARKGNKLLNNISNQFNLSVLQRNNSKSLVILNPFQQDTQILSGNSLIRNSVLYNSSKLGLEFTGKSTSVKQLLTYGSEQTRKTDYIAKSRLNIGDHWQFDVSYENSERILENAFFENRNYQWNSDLGTGTVSWQNLKSRISLKGSFTQGGGVENNVDGLKQSSKEIKAGYFYNMNTNTNWDLSFTQSEIVFNGSSNTPLGFQILNGLSQGTNYLWSANIRTLVSKNIQITFGYEGRKIAELGIIHIGRAEARYLF